MYVLNPFPTALTAAIVNEAATPCPIAFKNMSRADCKGYLTGSMDTQ
jgi:hypothetical protein